MNRLLRTSAIRLALRFTVLYALVAGIGLGVLYWATSRYVDAQIAAGLEQELAALATIDQVQGRGRLLDALRGRPGLDPENRRFTLLVSPEGTKLAGDLIAWPPGLVADGRVRNVWIEDNLIPRAKEDQDGYWPMIAAVQSDGSRLLLAQSIRQSKDLREYILSALLLTLLMIIGLTLVLGWRMGRQMLARVDQVNDTARQILRGDLNRRVAVSGRDDEFDELAENLNAMLEHIDRLVEGMRQVTDNVAHDLRRPLTRLRNRLDVTLLEKRTEQEYIATLEDIGQDVEGIIQTFNALLEIAQAEAGNYRGEWARVDLSALTQDLGVFYQDLAEEHGQTLSISIEPGICIYGNRHLIGQSLSNLLENAQKYAGRAARIELRLTCENGHVTLSVCDTGPGIPADRHEHVQQRFARLDSARSTPGNGLGLSLVAAAAQLHGTHLILEDNHPGLCARLGFLILEDNHPGLCVRQV